MARNLRKILIANRGEIACRIISSCRKLAIKTVAIYSDADKTSMHVSLADESQHVGPSAARDSYLSYDRIIEAAKLANADGIHPGYGFLSEDGDFARAVIEAGFIWVGPTPQTIDDMGDKDRARMLAQAAGVPVLSGSTRFMPGNLDRLAEAAAESWLSAVDKGGSWRRRDRAAARRSSFGAREDGADCPGVCGEVFRRSRSLSGTLHRARASHRDPAVWLRRRPLGASLRARMFDSAALSENRRGESRSTTRAIGARRNGCGCHRTRAAGALRRRRNGRVRGRFEGLVFISLK